MRRLDVLACVLVALLGMPALGFGQWLRYPTADVPRKADGKPDLTSPTPRLPDGKPDFSGIWHAGVFQTGGLRRRRSGTSIAWCAFSGFSFFRFDYELRIKTHCNSPEGFGKESQLFCGWQW